MSVQDTEEAHFLGHESCEHCGSSDGKAIYSGGTSYCFACEKWERIDEDEVEEAMVNELEGFAQVGAAPEETRGFKERRITRDISAFFGVRSTVVDGTITEHWYPYGDAWKKRTVATKQFVSVGDKKKAGLFGQHLFSSGKRVVVTEGELDAMAVAQMFMTETGKIWPVVSVPDGAQSASKACLREREWLRGFDEVIIMFDQDEPGIKAAQEVAKIVGAEKAKIAKLSQKDPSEVLVVDGSGALKQAFWDAEKWQPAGIINGKDIWEVYQSEKDAVYQEFPIFLGRLNKNIHGVRPGSITMLTSGTGCGKTTFVKEFIYNILKTTDEHIGLVSLEESLAETARGFISLDLNKRVGLPGVDTNDAEEHAAFERTLGTGRILMLDHQGSCEDSSLVDKMEYLALSGCKYIVLDHITIAVSESADGNTNAAIDALMSTMLKMTKRHDCHITCISHLRKVGGGDKSFEDGGDISMDDLRGSGSLKQISAQVIALSRNLSAENENERNTVKVKVLKDRWTGATGWAGAYRFDFKTGRLENAAMTDEHGFAKEVTDE